MVIVEPGCVFIHPSHAALMYCFRVQKHFCPTAAVYDYNEGNSEEQLHCLCKSQLYQCKDEIRDYLTVKEQDSLQCSVSD